ncbi:cysteine--tRNA ligase [endosymbiont 'TC1' of Trimyema compressum]|uniref:cysteine--tRNA ligase n=1 Tax=endosymbiont 'TC1' of Trimyema compressum TaxID=243899 RepID=UPI0007F12819|nr:cysteine--tRNA ligase [endosymbiont 'TC1' of Trimyema compressum]AMP21424.1 cysteine--tRNA ligase [endosymbiont 'TC1' of Trimyema compressum]
MKLYNTLTRKKENFVPIHEKEINMYVCGPTTYNYIHIGNARPMIVFDAMRKYFIHLGYDVTFIQNYTDVDDKIINKGKEEGIPALEIAATYIKEYEKDSASLGVMPATVYPKVSEHMNDIIHLVEGLVKKGLAYEAQDDVYFEVRKYPQYGKLSGRNIDDLQSGARVEVGSIKRDPLDFALWKSAKEGEVSWESPWGKGRPGWHIECSAMSLKYIKGDTLDIHGGGQDLIFPHHENEIAQSEGFSGKQFVNYWVHNGFITVNKDKMSKSLGNFFLVRDVLKDFSGEVIRYFLLSTHYRSPIDFNDNALKGSEKALIRLNRTYEILGNAVAEGIDSDKDTLENFFNRLEEKIEKALQDDLNTALAFSYFFEAGKAVGKALKENTAGKKALLKGYEIFKEYLETVFGILPYEKEAELLEVSEAHNLSDDLMSIVIDIRKMARDEKNFAYADKIRDALAELGIEILDTKEGTQWKKK